MCCMAAARLCPPAGPFVMTSELEIYQAFEDYRSGKLGAIEGAEER